MKFCVYLVYRGTSIYVGSGILMRPKESLKERDGDRFKIIYLTNDRAEAYRIETSVWKGLVKRRHHLLNKCRPDGKGKSEWRHTEETLRKQIESIGNFFQSEEHRVSCKEAQDRRWEDPANREELRQRMMGNTFSFERKLSEEHKEKLHQAALGRKLSEETKLKISRAKKAK